MDFASTSFSAIKDPVFTSNPGIGVSCILADTSDLELVGSNDWINFDNNYSSEGSTIVASFSRLRTRRMHFEGNKSFQGGCY